MKITNISPQKRRKDRYSIYCDGKYAVSLAENQLLEARLRIGDEISDSDLARLVDQSEFGKALDRVYNYLSFRPRSRREVETYLRRKNYDEEMAQHIIARLTEQDYLNDERFATDWVAMRQSTAPRSRRQLQAELREKGIDPIAIEGALETEAGDEVQVLVDLIERNRLRYRYSDTRKLMQHLSGKGYSYSTIQAALERLEESESED